jgi:hypothetical protein
MQINSNHRSPVSRRITNNETSQKGETQKGDDFSDLFETKASFEFKPGSVTLGDLANMFKKNDDGGFTLSVPNDVLVSSDTANAEPARPEILAKIDALTGQPVAGVKHTTRSIPQTSIHAPSSPKPFSAGRFQVDFGRPNEPQTGVIFETEAGPGHLANVSPGETPIEGGYISFLSDPSDSRSTGATLNKAEEKHLLANLYDRFAEPMTQKQADTVDSVISYAFAIHHKEGGQGDQVQASHRELAAAVAAKGNDGSASDQAWILR